MDLRSCDGQAGVGRLGAAVDVRGGEKWMARFHFWNQSGLGVRVGDVGDFGRVALNRGAEGGFRALQRVTRVSSSAVGEGLRQKARGGGEHGLKAVLNLTPLSLERMS